jgi:hypothetical protein
MTGEVGGVPPVSGFFQLGRLYSYLFLDQRI